MTYDALQLRLGMLRALLFTKFGQEHEVELLALIELCQAYKCRAAMADLTAGIGKLGIYE